MPIPSYNDLLPALLRINGDERIHSMAECIQVLAGTFGLSDRERQERVKSGEPRIDNRV